MTFVRKRQAKHHCAKPRRAIKGDIWRCDCGKRWKCKNNITTFGMTNVMIAWWVRRLLPWPR